MNPRPEKKTLVDHLADLETAVTAKDKQRTFTILDELFAFLKKAFSDPKVKFPRFLLPQEQDVPGLAADKMVDFILQMGPLNDELSQIQSLLSLENQDVKMKALFAMAVALVENKIKEMRQVRIDKKVKSGIQCLASPDAIVPLLPLMDLSFLLEKAPAINPARDPLLGKPPKAGSFVFPSQYIQMMRIAYWHKDAKNKVPYAIPAEKKQIKMKQRDGGLINRPVDNNQPLVDGDYLYIVSPKGGLYVCNGPQDKALLKDVEGHDIKGLTYRFGFSGQVQHSSIRGGQPVLCAGYLKIEQGKIAYIDSISGHYHPGRDNLLMACLHLHHKGILTSPNVILKTFDKQEITLQQLLDDPNYESLRNEYRQIAQLGAPEAKSPRMGL